MLKTQMFKAVLFDLGDTLIHPVGPWDPIMRHACQALSQTLCNHGIDVPCEAFADEFGSALRRYYARREMNLEEPTTFTMLRDLLASRQRAADDNVIRAALDALYKVTRSNWQPAKDALPVISSLFLTGLHMGVLSNAGDDGDVRILVREAGLGAFMDFVITSAEVGFRKPHPSIFKAPLQRWEFLPAQIAMVGDRLEADVQGARDAGMYSIWISADRSKLSEAISPPDAIIETLVELPALISGD